MARPSRPAHRAARSTTSRRENVQQSKAQVAKQARPKAIDFLSGGAASKPTHSTIVRLQEAHDVESDDEDEDTSGDSDRTEEDTDAPRVAQWIDDEELGLQEQTDDASTSPDSEGDDDHSASEAGPSRRLVSTPCVIHPCPFTDSYTFTKAIPRRWSVNLLRFVV